MPRFYLLLINFILICASVVGQSAAHAEYLGRYTDGKDYVVYFEDTPFGMTLKPALWTATQLLKQTAVDEFIVVDRAERGAIFHRDAAGRIESLTIRGMEGEGLTLTRAKEPLPVELLLSGKVRQAGAAYLSQSGKDPTRIIKTAERVLMRFPSKSSAVATLLDTIRPRFPPNAQLNVLLGEANVAADRRRAALQSFRRAHQIDPTDKRAISGLAMLRALPVDEAKKDEPWHVPFSLELVFEPPTTSEIGAIESVWRERDLSPLQVNEVATGRLTFEKNEFRVRVVSHLVKNQKHYGAIIIPAQATPGCCPIIVEAKGVSWNYFPLNLNRLDSLAFMADHREQFIYVVPSYRGEVLHFNGVDYQSEGDRTDAWEGATDDALALLNVALKTTPEADANRICVFGRSRGGSVALLMGQRDSRIRCVVEWAGPTDWFSLMGTDGWAQQELFAEGLRTQAKPNETGGQLVEHFLLKAVRGQEDLGTVRRRMLAGSPLYFAPRLPRVQMHYGIEDTSVPVVNGSRLAARINLSPRGSFQTFVDGNLAAAIRKSRAEYMRRGRSEAFFYPGQGHDTDRLLAPILSRKFLIDELLPSQK